MVDVASMTKKGFSFTVLKMELSFITAKEKKGLMENQKKINEMEEEEYVGNIWGWKFSFIGLGLILLLLSLMVYRHYTMGVPPGFEELDARNLPEDTLKVPSPE